MLFIFPFPAQDFLDIEETLVFDEGGNAKIGDCGGNDADGDLRSACIEGNDGKMRDDAHDGNLDKYWQ